MKNDSSDTCTNFSGYSYCNFHGVGFSYFFTSVWKLTIWEDKFMDKFKMPLEPFNEFGNCNFCKDENFRAKMKEEIESDEIDRCHINSVLCPVCNKEFKIVGSMFTMELVA